MGGIGGSEQRREETCLGLRVPCLLVWAESVGGQREAGGLTEAPSLMSLERMGGDSAQGGHAQREQQDSGQSGCGGGGAQRGPHGVRIWAWHRIGVGKLRKRPWWAFSVSCLCVQSACLTYGRSCRVGSDSVSLGSVGCGGGEGRARGIWAPEDGADMQWRMVSCQGQGRASG